MMSGDDIRFDFRGGGGETGQVETLPPPLTLRHSELQEKQTTAGEVLGIAAYRHDPWRSLLPRDFRGLEEFEVRGCSNANTPTTLIDRDQVIAQTNFRSFVIQRRQIPPGNLHGQPASGTALSAFRGPIVLAQYGRNGVDGGVDDPRLVNVERRYISIPTTRGSTPADDCDEIAENLITKIVTNLLGNDHEVTFQDRQQPDTDGGRVYNNCRQQSLHWLNPANAAMVFNSDDNEQLKMHLGGTHLVLFPLLASTKLLSTLQTTQRRITATLKADATWKYDEILTRIGDMGTGERLKLKLKADAWLQVDFKNNELALPMFHFEHKTDSDHGQAERKAILLSQLSWRRLFLAALQAGTGSEAKRSGTEGDPKRANEACQKVLFWFASLQGKFFVLGALKGIYDMSKQASGSHAHFESAELERIDIHRDGDLAVGIMYALARHLPTYFDSLPDFLDRLHPDQLRAIQDYDNAKSQSQSGSKRRQDSSQLSTMSSSGHGSGPGTKAGKTAVLSGLEIRDAMQTLLRDDVHEIATLWAIPHKSWVHRSRPFYGDHMFQGKWVGDGKLANEGTHVIVKAFCGTTEIEEYETEREILNMIRNVPHTQQLIVAKRQFGAAPGMDLAAVVSFLEEGTSKLIGRLDDIRTMGRQMLEALIGLHDIQIIHRDVKPSNILWNSALRRATLIDFGLSTVGRREQLSPSDCRKFSDGTRTIVTSKGVVGTDGYQAPELLAGTRYTSNVDVYSLGVTLFKLAGDAGIDDCQPLMDVVQAMTNPDPSERCGAAAALRFPFFCI